LGLSDNTEKITLAHDEQFLAIHLDFGARILGEKHDIADFYIHFNAFAFIIAIARTGG